MNWITKKLFHLSQKIRTVIKKRPTSEEIENRQNPVTNVTNIVKRLRNKIA